MPLRPPPFRVISSLLAACACAWLLCGDQAVAQTADRVRLRPGSTIANDHGGLLQGTVVDVSPMGITLEARGKELKVAVEDIADVAFGAEPAQLRDAREQLRRSNGPGALEQLAKVPPADWDGADPRVAAERAFVEAGAAGRIALASGKDLAAAQKRLAEFVKANSRSHHVFAMQELLGDVLMAMNQVDEAVAAYGAVGKGTPAMQVRAGVLRGNAYLRKNKTAEAAKEFEAAVQVSVPAESVAAAAEKQDAELGLARCRMQQGKAAEAADVVRKILDKANPDDAAGLGRLFNVLGEAQRAAGDRDRDAIIAFLTVDLVYNRVPEDHARALFNLVELWEKNNFPERSRESRQTLETTYPDSPWTKKLAAKS
ncbi:MAG: tetratricopeptide repeat protein [Pirellulales bacterium]